MFMPLGAVYTPVYVYIYTYAPRILNVYTRTFQRLICPRTCYRPAIESLGDHVSCEIL